MLDTGLRRIKLATRVNKPIDGEKIWYASGKVTDGNVVAMYQKSLCLIIGPEGVMFTNSFWLPKFLLSHFLLPWSKISEQTISSDRKFRFDGVEICLLGSRSQAVRPAPSIMLSA